MKKIRKILFFLLFLGAVIFRWLQINDANHGKYTVVAEDRTVTVDGLQHSIVKSEIYEMPALVENKPELKEFYSYATNHYVKLGMEKAFNSIKYVVYVELKVKNTSKKVQDIWFSDYYVSNENQSVLQGGYPELIKKLNDGHIDKKLKPQEEVTIKMCYDLLEENIGHLTYEKLRNMRLMIPISGYPDLKAISIHNAGCIKSKGTFDPYQSSKSKKSRTKKKNIPKDTETGTVLPTGSTMVEDGVGYQVEDVAIVENFKEYKEYNPDGWFEYYKGEYIKKDGSFETVASYKHGLPEIYYKKGYKNYAIFVKLSIENYTDSDKNLYTCFDLYNDKKTLEGPKDGEYISTLINWDKEDKDIYLGFIAAGEKMTLVLGYTRSIRNDWDIHKMPLYVSNNYDENASDFDLSKGKGGFGRYLQIQ